MEERSLPLTWNWICPPDLAGTLDVMDYVPEGWGLGREVCWEETCLPDRGIPPVCMSYFFMLNSVTASGNTGVKVTGQGHLCYILKKQLQCIDSLTLSSFIQLDLISVNDFYRGFRSGFSVSAMQFNGECHLI